MHWAAIMCSDVSLVAVMKVIQSLTINSVAETGKRCSYGANWHTVQLLALCVQLFAAAAAAFLCTVSSIFITLYFPSFQSEHKASNRCNHSILHPHPIPSPTRHFPIVWNKQPALRRNPPLTIVGHNSKNFAPWLWYKPVFAVCWSGSQPSDKALIWISGNYACSQTVRSSSLLPTIGSRCAFLSSACRKQRRSSRAPRLG